MRRSGTRAWVLARCPRPDTRNGTYGGCRYAGWASPIHITVQQMRLHWMETSEAHSIPLQIIEVLHLFRWSTDFAWQGWHSLCMAGVALGDVWRWDGAAHNMAGVCRRGTCDIHRHFMWQALGSGGRPAAGRALGEIHFHNFAWQ